MTLALDVQALFLPDEEPHAQLRLQRLQLPGQRRLAHVQDLGGLGDIFIFRDL